MDPNLANKIPQVRKTSNQYFSHVDIQINDHDLNFQEFETAYKSLKRNKASHIDNVNSNIVSDFFEELKVLLFHIFLTKRRNFFLTK